MVDGGRWTARDCADALCRPRNCRPKMRGGQTRFLKSSATIREFATKKGKMNDKMSIGSMTSKLQGRKVTHKVGKSFFLCAVNETL